MSNSSTYMPAEWHEQGAVQLTWPHSSTDWRPILKDVVRCYMAMARALSARVHLIIVAPKPQQVQELLAAYLPTENMKRITFCKAPSNDTWARDHGFITLLAPDSPRLLDFKFNGWGEKFPSKFDNCICRRMAHNKILKGKYEDHLDFVLEGGSIESDGMGTIMTTSKCLLAPNRNQPLTQEQIEDRLLAYLHAERILWLDHGYLAGDDTDSHIDTLARFCPDDTIAYVQCLDRDDEHYDELQRMEAQLKEFRTTQGNPYRLVPLPMAKPAYDEDGTRLPATYANFLITNGAVLMPTYGNPDTDIKAEQQLRKAFPNHEIIGIDCQILITQHGSLHCCTMQFPRETL
ncbi:MAG: agmatine deiminase family protein [Bacteroidaceae bacterium]|nr:agmatine deiminase family protein [Bacteroidaceae bacterium]